MPEVKNIKLARITSADLSGLPAPILRVLEHECYGACDLAARVNAWLDARDSRDKGECSHWMRMAGREMRFWRAGDDRGHVGRAANYVTMAAECWPLSKPQTQRAAEIIEAHLQEQERQTWPCCEYCGAHVKPETGTDTPHGLCCNEQCAAEMTEFMAEARAA